MPATSRWVLFDVDAETLYTGATNETISGTGGNGYVEGSSTVSGLVTISGGVSDQLQVNIDGNGLQQVTLTSGANLDARMVARELEFKLKQLPQTEFEQIRVEFENNKFKISSSSLGTTSSVAVANGSNDCLHVLGMASPQGGPLTVNTVNGAADANNAAYTGQTTISGLYKGQFSDIYTVMVGTQHPVSEAAGSGTNTYAGTVTTAGDWNEATAEVYTVTVSTANGSVMNNGSNNVPTFTVTSTQGDNIPATATELLYSDFYYNIGTKGMRMKFSDAPFGNGDSFTVSGTVILKANGASDSAAVGTAQYIWSSLREGKETTPTTSQVTGTAVGNKGLTIAFSDSGVLTARDEFRVIASGPQPTTLGVTTLNFGSVTVSTYSPAKAVWFQLVSGATVLSSPKFGLQSHGTAQHHESGNNDTLFAFGNAGKATPASDGTEWHQSVDPSTDLASDTPPAYLAATDDNLLVVSTAGASETIGVADGEMITDFIWLAVKLGAVETGANSTIIWRVYYDFS